MFGKVFSNVIVKDRCPRCGGNLILDVYDTDLTCMMCSRVWTPAQIQQFKFLSDLSTQGVVINYLGRREIYGSNL